MMAFLCDQSFQQLLERQRNDWSLEQPFYNDPKIFERDAQGIFMRHWLFAGHESRITDTGDYFMFEVAGEQIIVARAADGQIGAMFNVCRHRGSRVCSEPEGYAKCFVCPYHGWTYAPDGSLLVAKNMVVDFDKSAYGLHQCHVQTVEGLIFVCLADNPPPFDEAKNDASKFLQPHGLVNAKAIRRESWLLKANWKLVWENYNECYHCAHAHPQYCAVTAEGLPASSDSEAVKQSYRDYEMRWQQESRERGRAVAPIEWQGDRVHFCFRMPLKPGVVTHSDNGQRVAPLIGDMTEEDNGMTGFLTFPGFGVQAYCDYAVAFRFTPLETQLTQIEATWLVNQSSAAGVDYDVDRVAYLWSITTAQDQEIVEANQAGVNSRKYEPGPRAESEAKLALFADWYLRQLSP